MDTRSKRRGGRKRRNVNASPAGAPDVESQGRTHATTTQVAHADRKAHSTEAMERFCRLSEALRQFAATRIGAWSTASVYGISLLLLFPRAFYANDNVAILMDIDARVPTHFLSPFLGKCMAMCQELPIGEISPFGLMLYMVLAASMALYLRSLARLPACGPAFLFIVFALFSEAAFFFVRTGYNSAAILSGSASVLAACGHIDTEGSPRPNVLAGYGTLLALCFLIRSAALRGVVVFSAPVVGTVLWDSRKKIRWEWVSFLLPLVTVAVLDAAYRGYLLRTDAEYESFVQFNEVRGKFHDYPIAGLNVGNEKLLEANEWTANDYDMLRGWLYLHEGKYSVEKLTNIFTYSVSLPAQERRISPRKLWSNILRLTRERRPHVLLAVALVLSSIFLARRRDIAALLLYACYVFAVVVLMLTFMRFPDHVARPFLFSYTPACVFLFFHRSRTPLPGLYRRRAAYGLATASLLLFGIHHMRFTGGVAKRAMWQTLSFDQSVQHLEKQFRGKTLLIEPGFGLRYEFMDPLMGHLPSFKYVPAGWSIFSPRFQKKLREIGLTKASEVFPKMVDSPDFLFICRPSRVHRVTTFLRETYGANCRASPQAKLTAMGTTVYRIVSEDRKKQGG